MPSKQTETKVVLLSISDVQKKTGLSRSTIYSEMSKGEFPKSVSLTERRSFWIESEIDEWIKQKMLTHRYVYHEDA